MLPINDLSARIATQQPRIKSALERVVASGWFVLGPEVERFERTFAAYQGVEHCVGVANGTDALELALRALGVGPGDTVATVANAGAYTLTAMLAIGARPRFMDVDPDTRLVTAGEAERAAGAGCKVLVATHLYGRAVPGIGRIAERCAQAGVALLEDCAQAHGAAVDGRRVGSFGDAAAFSFYPTKNLGALGDGGAVVTRGAHIADAVRQRRQYGWTGKYTVEMGGGRNSRLDEMQAAVLSELLPGLDAANGRRREIAGTYSRAIRHPEVRVPSVGGADDVAHLYVVRSRHRDALRAHLRERGIASDIHYPVPDHRQPVLGANYADVRLPATEQLAREILTLPCYPEMSDEQAQRVVAAVNEWRPA
jgi:dTDP-4-amino-4,6-dideoxygalactose transaminase